MSVISAAPKVSAALGSRNGKQNVLFQIIK